jgi:hypothetical protein
MNEKQWLSCSDPYQMLSFLSKKGTERKHRLFGIACCRSIERFLTEAATREAVVCAERFIEGAASEEERREVAKAAMAVVRRLENEPQDFCNAAHESAKAAFYMVGAEPGEGWAASRGALLGTTWAFASLGGETNAAGITGMAKLLQDIFGPLPFRAVTIDSAWLAWNGGTVRRLAAAIYDDRLLPSGHLAPSRLAVLADALEEANCTDASLLAHLRLPGPHVRGCFALDAVLGKS